MAKRTVSIVFALVILATLVLSASAQEGVDIDRSGSLSVTMSYKGKPVPGGKLTVYQVANVHEDDGDYSFAYTPDFVSCPISTSELDSSELPAALAKIVRDKKLSGVTRSVDRNGKAVFRNLKAGLYLVVQTRAAVGYDKAGPFLVSLPVYENGRYRYDVEASPKVALEPVPTQPPDPPSPVLPQTGQILWPVPVLAVLGLALICAGWMLCIKGRKK